MNASGKVRERKGTCVAKIVAASSRLSCIEKKFSDQLSRSVSVGSYSLNGVEKGSRRDGEKI